VVAKDAKQIQDDMMEAAQQIWLAGLGAVAMATSQGSQLFSAMVEEGRKVEKTGAAAAGLMKDSAKDAAGSAEQAWQRFQGMMDSQVTGVLQRLGVPTRDEIARLTRKVEDLTASIEALKAKR
jgi:poly(hydroxyalkanoate) granule-associated protein